MIETIATATEMQNNFGKYLTMVMNGNEVIVTKNGKEVGRLIPRSKSVGYLTDALTGILHDAADADIARLDVLNEKYELND
jgi:prevent-host-death family protein